MKKILNYRAFYLDGSKHSLKSRPNKHKCSVKDWDINKKNIARHCWKEELSTDKKIADRTSRLITRNIKETIH